MSEGRRMVRRCERALREFARKLMLFFGRKKRLTDYASCAG